MDVHIEFKVVILSMISIVVVGIVARLYNSLVVKPKNLRAALTKQGINGPPPKFLLGNILEIKRSRDSLAKSKTNSQMQLSHNAGASLLPFFKPWRQKFGDVFVFALGNTQIVLVTRPDIVKEITTCTSLDLGKPSYQLKERGALLGQGILVSNGPMWAHQRKILAPELYLAKVKGMHRTVTDSAITLLDTWNSMIITNGGVADINIDSYMRTFSGDVISRACFGSNFAEGEKIFTKLNALQEASSKRSLATGIPGMRHLPTKSNREAWALEKEIHNLILEVVEMRNRAAEKQDDLLQVLLESAKESDLSAAMVDRFIVDNCKNIYLAGFETTAVSATWCLMLLAANPDWQDKVRTEALQVCKGNVPEADMLREMKQLTMVINESLRLYPPVAVVSREALTDLKLGGIHFPKGVNVWTLVTTLHTDPEIWGPDSYLFKPERFANGIIGACKMPHMYMPFGVGPRVCLGQYLALVELKVLISFIVSNFSFTLSNKYVHSPTLRLLTVPESGVDLLVKRL